MGNHAFFRDNKAIIIIKRCKGGTIRKVMGGMGDFQLARVFFFSPTACGGIFFAGETLCTNFFFFRQILLC